MFITETDNDRVVVDKPNGAGGYTQSVVDDTGLADPEGVAVDSAGDVFIADIRQQPGGRARGGAPTAVFCSAQSRGFVDGRRSRTRRRRPARRRSPGGHGTFGDGSRSSSAEDPSHTYRAPGTYTVSLTVTDSNQKTSTATQQVVVAAPHASLTYPTAGQTDVDTATPFSWGDIPAGQGYQLWIGTSRGDGSLLKSGALSAQHVGLPGAGAADRADVVGAPVHEGRGRLAQLAGRPVHGDRQPGRVHLPDRRPAEHRHADPVCVESGDRRAGLPAHDRDHPGRGGAGEIRDTRRERHQLPRAGAPDRHHPVCPARVEGRRPLARLSGRVVHRRPEPGRVHPPDPGTDPGQHPGHVHLEHQPGRDRLPALGRPPPRLRQAAEIRVAGGEHLLLPLPALPAGRTLWARIYTGVASGWGNWQDISFTTARRSIRRPWPSPASARSPTS